MTTTAQAVGQTVTKANANINVTVDGVSWGTFDMCTGGETLATVNTRRVGNMGGEVSYPALPSTSDMVVTRDYRLARDHARCQDLRNRRRVGTCRATVTIYYLDENGQVYGDPRIETGRLSNLTPSELDSTSSDPQLLALTIKVETK